MNGLDARLVALDKAGDDEGEDVWEDARGEAGVDALEIRWRVNIYST